MKKFIKYIYPSVRQDVRWHRIVKVIGWIISIGSLVFFPIVFALYFGLIQRAIFYIAYGEDKNKWLVKYHNELEVNTLSKSARNKLKWGIVSAIVILVIIFAWMFIANEQKSEISQTRTNRLESAVSYRLGSIPVEIGGFSWSVENIWNRGNKLSDKRYTYLSPKHTTEGKFIEIVIRVENNTNSSRSLLFNIGTVNFAVEDNKGRVYSPFLTNRTGLRLVGEREALSNENLGEFSVVQDIKPGIPYRFSVFFEVAKDSNSFGTQMTVVD